LRCCGSGFGAEEINNNESKMAKNNPYAPTNSPALDDLFDAFDFDHAVTQPYTE
jgi:hypothetical protein